VIAFGPEIQQAKVKARVTRKAVEEHREKNVPKTLSLSQEDKEIIWKAKNSGDDKFLSLWEGDWQDRYESQSAADLALCTKLAFWAGPDPDRVERLFSQAVLARRDKWQLREGYRERTVAAAIESALQRGQFYHGARPQVAAHQEPD